MPTLYYFAYGSNLHPLRLKRRVPSSDPVGITELPRRRLRFHKRGTDGSGKCDCPPDAGTGGSLMGVVYRLDARQKAALDEAEGPGYRTVELEIPMAGRTLTAFAYQALESHIEEGLAPYHWYRSLVLEGARYHGFPPLRIRQIEDVASIEDPDAARRARHHLLLAEMRACGRFA